MLGNVKIDQDHSNEFFPDNRGLFGKLYHKKYIYFFLELLMKCEASIRLQVDLGFVCAMFIRGF